MDRNAMIAQVIGLVGVILFMLSFQIKSNKKLFLVQVMANLMFATQFILLGAYAGCVNLIICIARNLLFMNRDKWKFIEHPATLAVFIVLFAINTAFNWKAWYDLLSFAAAASATVAFWTGNPRKIRTYNLFIASPCWIVYDICVGSWAGVLNEVIGITSISISIFRFGWKALGDNGEEFK